MKETVLIEKLAEEPYSSVICYPQGSATEVKRRLKELQKLNVVALEFAGEKLVSNLHVLGKGCVGIVVLAYMNDKKAALKIRRTDADRAMMRQESRLLRKANSVSVGPRLLGVSRNFLLMQFIEGDLLPDWLDKNGSRRLLKRVLRGVLEQCWGLDRIGLDHGELSHAPKHVIVDKEAEPFVVDFESASLSRRPSNVTSICQFLFVSGETAKKVAERLGEKDKDAIIDALRRYKNTLSFDAFGRLLSVLGV